MLINLFLFLFFIQPPVINSLYPTDKPTNKPTVIENNIYEEIDPFIDDLYYQDREIRSIGSRGLFRIAERSTESRNQVVKALVRVLSDNKLLVDQKELRYQTWYEAAYLLGKLQATETLDLLIKHLDYTGDKKDILLNHYPVIEIIAKIAPTSVSIPKLAKALTQDKNPIIRINSARCLGLINKKETRTILLKALLIEKNLQVKRQIQIELNKRFIVIS